VASSIGLEQKAPPEKWEMRDNVSVFQEDLPFSIHEEGVQLSTRQVQNELINIKPCGQIYLLMSTIEQMDIKIRTEINLEWYPTMTETAEA